jgi:ribosomal protein S18 acetylase RimI-like enzyme
MNESGEMKVSEISSASDINLVFPDGFSFFEPYLRYFIVEVLEIGGEAYVSRASDDNISGIFTYDDFEKIGTVYTRSRKVFDYFYGLKPFDFLFAELRTGVENEIYDIYTIDLESQNIIHRFSHEISMADEGQISEIERFMALAHPGMNRKWVRVAMKNGDKCFVVRLGSEIAGLGWVSFVNSIGRIHSLFVKSQFRRLGIGEDILYARLLWLKSKHAHLAFSEISRCNSSCSRIALKAQMMACGQVFQYSKKNLTRKEPLKSWQMCLPSGSPAERTFLRGGVY